MSNNKLVSTLLPWSMALSVVAVAASGQAYGQYWDSLYYCPGASASPVNAGWTGSCLLTAVSYRQYVWEVASVGTYLGADSASAISYADESYQQIEAVATIMVQGISYSQSRKCEYDETTCYDVGEGLYVPPYYWAYVWH